MTTISSDPVPIADHTSVNFDYLWAALKAGRVGARLSQIADEAGIRRRPDMSIPGGGAAQIAEGGLPSECLVFPSVRDGKPMRDNNILSRHMKPAGRKLGIGFVNWRCLRTSHATWLKMAGADVKDAQAQMRHSRASTTLDIYQQFVPQSQRRVINSLSELGSKRVQ